MRAWGCEGGEVLVKRRLDRRDIRGRGRGRGDGMTLLLGDRLQYMHEH